MKSFVTLGVIVEVVFCLFQEHSGRYHDNGSFHGVGFSILVNKGPPSVELKMLAAMSPWPHMKGRNFTRDFMWEHFQNTEMSVRSSESQRIIPNPVIFD